jgi:hypothetical protein
MPHAVNDRTHCRWGHGALKIYPDGSRRCPTCRTQDRKRQKQEAEERLARAREQGRFDRGVVEAFLEDPRLEDAEMPYDEFCEIVEEYFEIVLSDDNVRMANALWQTGEAGKLLARWGMSARTFAEKAGVSNASVSGWIRSGKAPKSAERQLVAAKHLLQVKTAVDYENARLLAHGKPPTLEAQRKFPRCPAQDLDKPWTGCDGCKRLRQAALAEV